MNETIDKPRCAVCGGPNQDGSGCEFCPAVVLEETLERILTAAGRSVPLEVVR